MLQLRGVDLDIFNADFARVYGLILNMSGLFVIYLKLQRIIRSSRIILVSERLVEHGLISF